MNKIVVKRHTSRHQEILDEEDILMLFMIMAEDEFNVHKHVGEFSPLLDVKNNMSFLFTLMNNYYMTKLDHRTFCVSNKLTSQEIVYPALENATNSRKNRKCCIFVKVVHSL